RPLPPVQEASHVTFEEPKCTTATRCYVRIKGNPVVAVLDSSAAVSIMTKKLVDKLRLKILEKSSTVVVTATGAKTRALGKIKDLRITIQNTIIPSTVQVIESSDETLLLGTDWFQKVKARIHFDEQKLILKYQGRTIEVPISYTGNEALNQHNKENNWDVESGDTFDEFTYEDEDLDEAEGYYTLESSEEEPDIYENPWKNEHQAGRIHNNANGFSRSQEPKKEKQELIEKDKQQTELAWLINLAEYDEYDKYNNYRTESEDSNEEWIELGSTITYNHETGWDWWDINEDDYLSETILERITSLIQDLLEVRNAAVVQVQKAQDAMKDRCNKNIKKWPKLEIGDK
ncbi:5962_t:CDS:2, partial [Scutellospora calospora]